VGKLRQSLLALDPGGALAHDVFKAQGQIRGFVAAQDADYDGTREVERINDQPPPATPAPTSRRDPK
jgi:hypothetical protein